ncbi:methylmalonyl Co-A mutase-associated GTPase MeaB [Streptomyces sp. NPDC001292]|uniref:methylmalonyl Co-A mutase-associated GTPase MeaB n=1 Tax=Streptomyces sp. NPDC001292 TaxID=3364558 RepID=UPI0036C51D87
MTEDDDLVSRILARDQRAGARMITLVENDDPGAAFRLAELFPHTGRAAVIGVTGPPGAGKSTLVDGMVRAWRARGRTVGVLAVDPSSPFTGGAILGDRIRMASLTGDPGVYVRSMASRAHLGGLAEATPAAVRVLDAMGMDVIVVETVGVGQSEIAIAGTADCTVLVTMPGAGDGIQAMKAGVLEIGDVFVVNKADREGALRTRRELKAMLRMQERTPRPVVLLTKADVGDGVEEVVRQVEDFIVARRGSGRLEKRRLRHLEREALELIGAQARRRTLAALDQATITELSEALRERRQDPATVAARALAALQLAYTDS